MVTLTLSVEGEYSKNADCSGEDCWSVSVSGGGSVWAGVRAEGEASVEIDKKIYGVELEGELGVSTGLSVSASLDSNGNKGFSACWDGITVSGSVSGSKKLGDNKETSVSVGGSCVVVKGACYPSDKSNATLLEQKSDDQMEPLYEADEFYGFDDSPLTGFTEEDLKELEANCITPDELAQALGYASKAKMEQALNVTIDDEILSYDKASEIFIQEDAKRNGAQKGTCAEVKLQLKQTAVLTRDAFDAQLVLSNDTG